jgi:outer membrane lipoprotein-sorting protein
VESTHRIPAMVALILFAAALFAQSNSSPTPAQTAASLDKVLSEMDSAASNFRTADAHVTWEQYQKVVDDTDVQEGTVSFRRNGKDIQMAADITKPAPKNILYADGKVQVFEPKMNRVTNYPAGKNRADIESFVVLGFGGGGHDLQKNFDVKYAGTESLNGVQTEKLELVPKSARLRGMFEKLIMWIDPKIGVAVQQKFFQPEGDYRLTKYSDIHLNQKLSDNVFKLKTDSKTKFISPQG